MKQLAKSILVPVLIILVSHVSVAQNKDRSNFKDIDLKELRKVVLKELMNDGLISSKKESVHLSLRSQKTVLNGEELTDQLHQKYGNLAAQFKITRGSYRTVYITNQCTAVGDFYEDSFDGKVKGKMRLAEVTPTAQ